jgi:uncharacterized protein YbjT (DUF2867 family)
LFVKKILVTGASGNVGKSVVKYLFSHHQKTEIIAGVFNLETGRKKLNEFSSLQFRELNFEKQATFSKALKGIDTVFLLRPPQLADVQKYFEPFFQEMENQGVRKIVFLSVQGAEKSKVIPHNKIERLIQKHHFNYIFVRPGYFMQNLTTTLLPDIRDKNKIFLPAGNAKFNWVDIENIGELSAELILHFENFKNQPIEITGTEQLDFTKVAESLSVITGVQVTYNSPGLVNFYRTKKKAGMKSGMILVMIMLHFLPRVQKQAPLSANYQKILQKQPTKMNDFLNREKDIFYQP